MKTLITKLQAGLSGNEKKSGVKAAQAVLRQNLPQDKTMKKRTSISLLTILLQLLIINCSLLIATADATIRYVSKTGSSTPPYTTWETAADSIQKCIEISEFGDTIYVANGVYEERVTMIPGLSLIGSGADSCVIDSRSLPPLYTIRLTDSCYLAGFQIFSENSNLSTGVSVYDVNIQITNVVVKHNSIRFAGNGIRISTSSLGFDNGTKIITQNIIKDVQNGIFSEQTGPIISENVIIQSHTGLKSQILSKPTYHNNIILPGNNNPNAYGFSDHGDLQSIIKNNLFFGRGNRGIYSTGGDIIQNNIIYGPWNFGFHLGGSTLQNNHIEGTNTGLRYWGGTSLVYKYNNMWNNNYNFQNVSPDTTNIFVDPMFVNPDSMDFKLQMYSQLIDAGDPDILDVDGSRSDIGLYGGPYGMSYQYLDLPPRPPGNVLAVIDSPYITIKWNPNTETDFSHYNLYRDTTAGFPADSTTIVMSLSDTFYNHIIPPGKINYYYKLTAVDNQRNESLPSEEIAINITSLTMNEYPITINDYILYQNYPNPFNPSTKISYRLKEGGYVKLYVYDIKGELVDILVNQHQEGGYYEVEFSPSYKVAGGNQDQGTNISDLASGIYIYQIMVRSENNIPVFTDMKKMLFIK